jgi:uncharacterized membrane protein YciS (DUF1049 family)
MKRMLSMILVFFLIIPSLSLTTIAQEENIYEQVFIQTSSEQENQISFIKRLLRARIEYFGYFPSMRRGKYYVYQYMPPVPIQASPGALVLDYNKDTYFDIGARDPDTGEWLGIISQALGGYDWGWMSKKTAFSFEIEPFENMDVWNIQFDPPVIELHTSKKSLDWPGSDQLLKTNVSIRLNPNVTDPSMFTQDIVLRINIWREQTMDKLSILSGAPSYAYLSSPDYEEYTQKQKELGIDPYFKTRSTVLILSTYAKWSLFFVNLQFPDYEKLIDSTVEILLKVNRYHQLDLIAPETVKIKPYEVKTIPVSIQNIGSHIDTFNFRIKCDNKDMVVVPPPSLTLKPGEKGEALVGVAAPRSLYALGAISNIRVEAFSVNDPEQIFVDTITLKSEGIYATGTPTINIFLIIIILIIAFIVLRYIRIILRNRKKTKKIKEGKKKIKPAEKKIEKSVKKEEKPEKKEFKGFFSNIFKETKKDKDKKIEKEPEAKPAKKEETIKPVEIEPKKPDVDKKLLEERLKKQKVIEKIMRQQKNK